jgi:autotransporter-associated beta strand protein
VKIGAGTLTLTGLNEYSGYTSVEGGTLSFTQASLYDAADVLLHTGGFLNLNTSGAIDVIDSLYINGISQQAGIWGPVGSVGVDFTSPLITGNGFLQVLNFDLPGDFDNSLLVDGADLTPTWRGGFAANATGDTDGDGDSDGADFLIWQRFLGQTAAAPTSGAVPEPAAVALAPRICAIWTWDVENACRWRAGRLN